MSCQAGYCCISQSLYLSKAADDSSPRSLHTTSQCYLHKLSRKRSFRVSASWISPGPVTKVCALFSSRVWPSSSGLAIKKEQISLESSPSHLTSCVTLDAAVTKYLAKATYGSRRIFRIQLEDAVHHSAECMVGHEMLGTCHLQSQWREIDKLLLSRSPP